VPAIKLALPILGAAHSFGNFGNFLYYRPSRGCSVFITVIAIISTIIVIFKLKSLLFSIRSISRGLTRITKYNRNDG